MAIKVKVGNLIICDLHRVKQNSKSNQLYQY